MNAAYIGATLLALVGITCMSFAIGYSTGKCAGINWLADQTHVAAVCK